MKDVNILFDSPMKFEIRDEYYLSGKTGICYGWIYHSQYWAKEIKLSMINNF